MVDVVTVVAIGGATAGAGGVDVTTAAAAFTASVDIIISFVLRTISWTNGDLNGFTAKASALGWPFRTFRGFFIKDRETEHKRRWMKR